MYCHCNRIQFASILPAKIIQSKYASLINVQNVVRYKRVARPQSAEEVAQMDTFQFAGDRPRKQRKNEVYCWGFSATGALGDETLLGRMKKGGIIESPKRIMVKSPRKLKAVNAPDMKVIDVAAGAGFTVFAATLKNSPHILFGCGLNTDSQLGHQATQGGGEPLLAVANVVPIKLPLESSNSPDKEFVHKVSCGRAHTVCLTNLGNVYSLGNNSFGQCGRPIVEKEKYFASYKVHQIRIPEDGKIIDVVCGQDHTHLLSSNGSVYSCGLGNDGQLGNGSFNSTGQPTKVIGDVENEKIVQVSSVADSVLALNDKGQVFGWGNSEYHQLASVTQELQMNTARFLNLERITGKIVNVASGGSMSGLVNHEGIVFVWGYGILGMGPNVTELKSPSPLSANLFGANMAMAQGGKVISLVAGLNHFAAINDKADLYMWGRNNKCNLGINKPIDTMFPYRISLAGQVKKVSLGPDHTVAIAKQLI